MKKQPWYLITSLQTAQVQEQVTAQVERLLTVLGGETLSAKALLERLGLKHRQSFSSNYLRPALELGLIEMTAPDKPNSSRQKYRAVIRERRYGKQQTRNKKQYNSAHRTIDSVFNVRVIFQAGQEN